ncbi:MAG: Na+/H+ antiporter subunit E [Candidatus Binatia bacterium]
MKKTLAAVGLLLRFLRAVAVAGMHTVWVILRSGSSGEAPAAGFVQIAFAPMTARGAALLGCMVSLTPGTTVIDIDMKTYRMAVHLLDATTARDTVESIRSQFEPGLLAWFGVTR